MNPTHKFCPLPWISQAIRNDGIVRVCSNSHSSESKGALHKNNGALFDASVDDLMEAFNSEDLRQLRLDMLNNKSNSICTRCDLEESKGIKSRRNVEKINWSERFDLEDATLLTSPDGHYHSSPRYLDLRFGNKCNLKCRSCSPTDSNYWYEDYQKLWNQNYFNDGNRVVHFANVNSQLIEDTKSYRWYESSNFLSQILPSLERIEHIYIVGGEPLLIQQHFSLLEKCIELNVANKITIEYNSNITLLPIKVWDLWGHFKKINIGASIDGIGKVNDYIRHPSRFDNVYANLLKIDSSQDNISCWITTTVQVYNAHHLPEIIKWLIKNKFKKIQNFFDNPLINCHPLHNPNFLSTKIFPQEIKKWIGQLYLECIDWVDQNAELYMDEQWSKQTKVKVKELLISYQQHMNSEDWSHLFPKFLKYSNGLDSIRKESLEYSIPDLWAKIAKLQKNSN